MSELKDKRIKFTRLLCWIIAWANSRPGWAVALGRDFDESSEKLRHRRGSLHYDGLANDLALYRNGDYETDSEAYRPIGEKWKSLDPDCAWGGDFVKPDGNHFSIKYQGKK